MQRWRLLPDSKELGWTPLVWLIYLLTIFIQPAMSRAGAMEWTLTIAGVAVFLPLYFRGYWVRGNQAIVIIAAITALGVLFLPFNQSGGVFFIYAAAFAFQAGRSPRPVVVIATIVVICTIQSLVLGMAMYQWVWAVIFSVLIGGINIHYERVRRDNWKIRLAQDEIERLARIAERERIARDLHDLLGHTLSVIILKSELASKLAERDPAKSVDEIRDVERISREALSEVRAAVRGYRSAGLRGEIASIRSALQDAGVQLVVDADEVSLSAEQESVLALALREASTNVLRHARASRCELTLRTDGRNVVLRVSDDGKGGGHEGTGIKGMRERVEEAGGTLRRDTGQGTTITIELPVERARTFSRAEIA